MTCMLPPMSATRIFRESRRSTRVPLKLAITVDTASGHMTCEGETVIVNLHGALISTSLQLKLGTKISIHVYLTDKHSNARIAYVDAHNPLRCGIELEQPRDIWGVPLPPHDWGEVGDLDGSRDRR